MCAPVARVKEMVQEDPYNPVAKHWVVLYRCMPTIYFPWTKIDISFTLFSVSLLSLSRLAIRMIMTDVVGWRPEDSDGFHEANGCMTAALHSLILVPGLFVALTTQPYRITAHLNAAPQWWQDLVDALFQFCTGYMVYDSVASFFMLKGFNLDGTDFLFLGHHIATAVYMTQCRILQAGQTSAMICMFLGEITNPFQNGHSAAAHAIKLACCNGTLMQQFHRGIEVCFAISYFGIRAIIAPIFFFHVTFSLLFESTRKNIPFGLRLLWIVMIWGVEIGSYPWIMECWRLIQARLGGTVGSDRAFADEL